jgi:very-short-patch-repair endonuclease
MNVNHLRNCPKCNREIVYTGKWAKYSCRTAIRKNMACHECGHPKGSDNPFFGRTHSKVSKQKISNSKKGKSRNEETRKKIGLAVSKRYTNPNERIKTSKQVTEAIHRPEVRKKHMEALHHSKWLKVRTDKGQLELLEKWNNLGFNFEPNFQIKTDQDLFYLDGYDQQKNVVLEFDGKYHFRSNQQKKDFLRQTKVVKALNPKKFWRYNSVNKTITNVIERKG